MRSLVACLYSRSRSRCTGAFGATPLICPQPSGTQGSLVQHLACIETMATITAEPVTKKAKAGYAHTREV
jgi:hypothetical protein